MPDGVFPVRWTGRQAVVTLPEHIDVSKAATLREQLLALINRGAAVLIVDMTVTGSCDHAAVQAFARAYQRAAVSGAQLRLVVIAQVVMRVLGVEGLDRPVLIYPSPDAATAAGTQGTNGSASFLAETRTARPPDGPAGPVAGRAPLRPSPRRCCAS